MVKMLDGAGTCKTVHIVKLGRSKHGTRKKAVTTRDQEMCAGRWPTTDLGDQHWPLATETLLSMLMWLTDHTGTMLTHGPFATYNINVCRASCAVKTNDVAWQMNTYRTVGNGNTRNVVLTVVT